MSPSWQKQKILAFLNTNLMDFNVETEQVVDDISDVVYRFKESMSCDMYVCGFCGEEKPTPSLIWFRCICGGAGYCSKSCQRKDWERSHDKLCATIPLWRAALSGDPGAVVEALKRKNVRVNFEHPKFGMNAVMVCTIKDHPGCLMLLIENGASFEKPSPYGLYPVHTACAEDSPNCLLLLLASGADVNKPTTDMTDTMPIGVCCARGHVRCLSICLVSGADPDRAGQNNGTAARGACQFGYDKCLMMLIYHGANVEVVRNGQIPSPLDYAFSNKHRECIGLLLAEGATFIDGLFVTESAYVQVCNSLCRCSVL